MENTILKSLLTDLDYQKNFSYEERVENFNKWGMATHMEIFTPLANLSKEIISYFGYIPDKRFSYGHGETILNATRFEKAIKSKEENASDSLFYYKKVTESKEWAKSTTDMYRGQYVNYWIVEQAQIKVKLSGYNDVTLPNMNIYEKINEWLMWFNFIVNPLIPYK